MLAGEILCYGWEGCGSSAWEQVLGGQNESPLTILQLPSCAARHFLRRLMLYFSSLNYWTRSD